MDRRTVLGGLAAVLVAAPALAQTSGSSSRMPSGSASGASSSGAAMGPMGGQMGQAEMQHIQQTMQLGMVALETSRVAMNKARNEDLKRFANFEVEEQTTLSEALRSMMEPAATAATGGQSSPQNMAMQMDAGGSDMLQALQSQQPGADFDRAYLQGQLQGHRSLLQAQERYLQSNPQSRELVNVSKLARGRILEHIALLETMQKQIQ